MPAPTADDHAFAKAGLVRSEIAPALTASRPLTNADAGKVLAYSGADAITLTAPTGLRPGFSCRVVQVGAGAVTIAAGAGATVLTALSSPATTEAGTFVDVNGVSQPGEAPIFAILAGSTGGGGSSGPDLFLTLLRPDSLVYSDFPAVGDPLASGYGGGLYIAPDGTWKEYAGDPSYVYTADTYHFFDLNTTTGDLLIQLHPASAPGPYPAPPAGYYRFWDVDADADEITYSSLYEAQNEGAIFADNGSMRMGLNSFFGLEPFGDSMVGRIDGFTLLAAEPPTNTGAGTSLVINGAAANMTGGVGNILIGGVFSSWGMTTGSNNVLIAANPGITTGSSNTAIGSGALGASAGASSGNVALGKQAGANVSTGQNNTCVGTETQFNHALTGSNNTVLGYRAESSAEGVSDEFTLGNASIATLRCAQTSITAVSDQRDKADIKAIDPAQARALIMAAAPVQFRWEMRHEEGKPQPRAGVLDSGFLAQALREAQEAAGVADHARLVYEANPERLEASYGRLLPYLVALVRQQQMEIEALKNHCFGD